MKLSHLKTLSLFLVSAVIFYACGTAEDTIEVVEETPRAAEAEEPDTVDEQFTEITLGLIDPVTNFDPLFAENLSTQRVLSLVYEGLYSLDRDGNSIPAIATDVEISEDGLEYVFTLSQNKFYHNSPVFTSGIGRRVTAADVKQAFERTATLTIPETAAELLMGISGFENFYLEQRSVYDINQRVLEGVAGIQVIDSQTLGIVLKENDPQFLEKLASPYLFIYPQEAVGRNNQNLSDQPVGTGPYRFNRAEESGRIVLSRDDRRNSSENQNSLVNQINLIHYSDEGQLYQEFANGPVDWLPEIGPEISGQVLNEEEMLQPSLTDSFNLVENNAERIIAFYLNERATVNHEWLINRLAYLTDEDITTRGNVTLQVDDFEITEEARPNEQYYASFTDDAITQALLSELHNIIFIPESSLVLFDIRIPTRQTSIYTEVSNSFHEALAPLDSNYWMRMDTRIAGLYEDHIAGIEPTTVPWLLHIDQIRVRNSESGAE